MGLASKCNHEEELGSAVSCEDSDFQCQGRSVGRRRMSSGPIDGARGRLCFCMAWMNEQKVETKIYKICGWTFVIPPLYGSSHAASKLIFPL